MYPKYSLKCIHTLSKIYPKPLHFMRYKKLQNVSKSISRHSKMYPEHQIHFWWHFQMFLLKTDSSSNLNEMFHFPKWCHKTCCNSKLIHILLSLNPQAVFTLSGYMMTLDRCSFFIHTCTLWGAYFHSLIRTYEGVKKLEQRKNSSWLGFTIWTILKMQNLQIFFSIFGLLKN